MRRMRVVAFVVMAVMILAGVVALALAQADRGTEAKGIQVAQARQPGGDRESRMAQYMEQMRERMKAAGATDADIAAVTAYRTQQREIQAPLTEAMGALREAAGEGATDAQAKDAVGKYEAAMKTVKAQLAKAEQDLKTKLDLANKPRLHALLLVMGTLDNGQRGRGMMGGRPGGAGARPRGGGGAAGR